ncbi:MAG: PorT family protein [Bacteroidaceae bacterium]|nr:PorT family protein [Bacteroidaceae bacterium]MBQ3238035.1 PorT family protein [Bacteroidaceae bacterium]MBQ7967827.1 PorT family protein [Bacteroidaceae bacterium]MBR3983396.1 PorT family protein [Bacteroidaceae bacterium]
MRRLSLILIACIVAIKTMAQVGELRDNVSIGFNGGYNLSSVDFSPTIKQGLQPGYTGGATLRYTTEKYFALICAAQLEVNFAQRGWNETIDDGSDNTYRRTTNYIEIPFFAHLGWGKENRGFQFFINAGPQIGLFLSDEEFYGFTQEKPWDPSNRPNNQTAQYGKKVENTLEYGIAGGAGIELKTGIGNFIVEGRYFFGLSDMFGNSKADPFGRSANTTITAKITYLVDILK